jgi:hypothetical protein
MAMMNPLVLWGLKMRNFDPPNAGQNEQQFGANLARDQVEWKPTAKYKPC